MDDKLNMLYKNKIILIIFLFVFVFSGFAFCDKEALLDQAQSEFVLQESDKALKTLDELIK